MQKVTISIGLSIYFMVLLFGCAGGGHKAETAPAVKLPEAATPSDLEKSGSTEKTSVAQIEIQTATVTASRLNLRSQGSPKGDIVDVLKSGDRLEVVSRSGKWLEVTSSSGKTGWVYGSYVQIMDEAENKSLGASAPALTPQKPQPDGKIVEESLTSTDTKMDGKPAGKASQKPSAKLQEQLEAVWNDHRQAHAARDMTLLKKTTSDHSYGTMINTLASAGKELKPDDLTFLYALMPDLTTLKFVEMKENGPTVGLLYLDEGEQSADPNLAQPVRFVFIKFVKEARGWTVDGMQTTGMPKYQADGSETIFDPTSLPEELAIDGKVLPGPKPMEKVKVPEVAGVIDISSYDYKTEVSINGIPQKATQGGGSSAAIEGGLKRGVNQLVIESSRFENAESDWPPEVTIRYLLASGEEKEAFKFEPEENFEGKHSFTFTVE